MRQTFVVATIVLGLVLWIVAVAYAAPARCVLAGLEASAGRDGSVLVTSQRCATSILTAAAAAP